MKKLLYLIIILALLVIGYSKLGKNNSSSAQTEATSSKKPKVHTGAEPFKIGDGRLKDHPWLRFNGTYKTGDARNQNVQHMRFYPEGNVTLISGRETPDGVQLKTFMAQDTPNNGEAHVRNSLVEIKGDSLFFTTKSLKGEIDYKGTFATPNKDKLSFFKHSRINGRTGQFEYTFVAD